MINPKEYPYITVHADGDITHAKTEADAIFNKTDDSEHVYKLVESYSDAEMLTEQLLNNGATHNKIVEIIDGFGDFIDWSKMNLVNVVAEVWQSDINSGDEPDSWIINEICRAFNVQEVTE